ncbi:cytochrome c biogenesis protein [Candidatus Woesearchaeota archaeon]|nr:cytochrome c biogenesis protein [Candidatus Woesearchaeota archaeon]
MKKALFLIFALLISAGFAYAVDQPTDLYFFYGKGCPHCGKMQSFLEDMQEKYSTLNVIEKETYFDNENRNLFIEMAEAFGYQIEGVPTTFIDGKMIVGFSDVIGEEIEQEIIRCVNEGCESPINEVDMEEVTMVKGESSPLEDPEKTKLKEQLTIGAVLSAAAVDAINPCAFAVLIILMTTILTSKSKKRALLAGLAFSLSIYISYFLMGIGLYSAIQVSGLTHGFYAFVAVLAIIVGLLNLKDYLWYGKWFVMEVPMSWRPKLQSLIRGITSIPGAFMIGFAVSLFLLPCTSGPYIVILGLLAKIATKNYAITLLLIYNFIFILPMLLITAAIYFGFTTTQKAEEWRKKKLEVLHLIAGIIILLLGIGMFVAMGLGYI